jgi:hypothetical protein
MNVVDVILTKIKNNMEPENFKSKKSSFFYRNWWLFYLLIFILIGLVFFVGCNSKQSINLSSIHSKLSSLEDQIECGLRRKKEIPPRINEENPAEIPENAIPCNSGPTKSGGQGVTENQHSLGSVSGKVIINYDMINQPDQIDIIYNGKIVASSGKLVSGASAVVWNYYVKPGDPTFCTVRISAPEEGTAWSYTVGCPE